MCLSNSVLKSLILSPSCIILLTSLHLRQYFLLNNLQLFALFDLFLFFSLPNALFFMRYVRRSWVLITDWD